MIGLREIENELLARACREGVAIVQQGELSAAIRLALADLGIVRDGKDGGAPTLEPTASGRAFARRSAA